MSLLPTKVTSSSLTTIKSTQKIYTDYEYDPITNSFTGKIVSGDKALKGWIYFALRIARYRYAIYSWNYGCELENIIGTQIEDEDYKEMIVEHYVRDALLINPYIDSINNVIVAINDEKIKISCVVYTKYGVIYVNIE